MKFGVREIANVVFRARSEMQIGNINFKKNQPVFYMDTAKTSTLEGAATTVYATGGRGNVRLIAWEGEKTLTFTVEDALLSSVSFSMLSGAGLLKGKADDHDNVYVHTMTNTTIGADGIDLTDALQYIDADNKESVDDKAPMFVMLTDDSGDLTGEIVEVESVSDDRTGTGAEMTGKVLVSLADATDLVGKAVVVDYYIAKNADHVSELQVDAENFAGEFYVEADTLFRGNDGEDRPAIITLPRVKIQSNFTFAMASTGDPSTFTFTMDAFPDYTYFNRTKKVLCVIQVVEDVQKSSEYRHSVMHQVKVDEEAEG